MKLTVFTSIPVEKRGAGGGQGRGLGGTSSVSYFRRHDLFKGKDGMSVGILRAENRTQPTGAINL